jgi:leucyl aminopeptidase
MGSAKTRFSISSEPAAAIQVDGLVIPVFKKPEDKNSKTKTGKKNEVDSFASIIWPFALDKAVLAEISAIAADEKFDGGKGKLLTVRQSVHNKLNARRLVLVGLGDASKLQPRHWENNVQKAVGSLLGLKNFHTIAVALPTADHLSLAAAVSLAVDGVSQATYKSMEAKEPLSDLQKAILITEDKANGNLQAALKQGEALAAARSLVKDLVNHPSNLKNTNTLVNQAKTIAKNALISVTVQDKIAWISKNMPCFYTVALGSVATDPPKFIQLRYKPKSGKAKKHIAIVGKSVIFDTGGYQVKPGDYMVTMKGDMTGGAVVLATMQALAELQPPNIEVSAYLAATPNKIDSDAMIPDSIVNTTCGKKVEIRHTDAEGRLTLIDAVSKAMENQPDEIITIATLTGSASAAVGYSIALMGNNEALRERVAVAGRLHGEPIQTLDVVEEDYDNIKSKLDGADIINTSQRKHRGAQSAAAFVMSGAPEDMPMAHLDIAGADMTADEKATGISVKTIIQYLLNEDAGLAGFGGPAKSTPTPASAKSLKAESMTSVVKATPVAQKASAKLQGAKALVKSAKLASKPVTKATRKPEAKASSVKLAAQAAVKKVARPATKAKATKATASAVRAATVTKKVKPAVKNAPKDRQPPKKAGKTKLTPKPKGK